MGLVKEAGGILHRRNLATTLGKQGIQLDWHDKELMDKIDKEIGKISEVGAKALYALVKREVPVGETGALRRSVKVHKETGGLLDRWMGGHATVSWIVQAGDDYGGVDYAAHVELGRYFKDTNTRVPAIPFIRRPVSIMRKKMRRLFFRRLKRILK